MSNSTSMKPSVESASPSIKPLVASESESALMERMKLTLNYDELTNCMRCGFCQPACPTYKETGLEAASPRGRIALMKAVVDDIMVPDQSFKQQIDLCLGCRACEPVCPADVKYGQLLEQTRAAIEEKGEHRWFIKIIRTILFKHLFPYQKRLKWLGLGLKFHQRSGLRWLVRRLGIMRLFPASMREMERILPDASMKGVAEQLGSFYPAKGNPIARVGMFRGCIMDVVFTETNVNTVKLLSEAGFDVIIIGTQNCCGALHAHSGELAQAKELAKRNIKAFADANVDYIVSNAGGCGALLVEYGHLLHDEPEYAEKAKQFSAKVKDVSQMIMEQGRIPQFAATAEETAAATPVTITYQDSCHLRNVMKASNAPRDLMERITGIHYAELVGSDRCCGSAGIYNIVQPEMSLQILDHKMEHVAETQARYLLTSNPGCLLQMKLGIARDHQEDRTEAVHIVDFLYERIVHKA